LLAVFLDKNDLLGKRLHFESGC